MNTHWINYNGLELRVDGRLLQEFNEWFTDRIILNDVDIEPMLRIEVINEINRIVFEENYKTE